MEWCRYLFLLTPPFLARSSLLSFMQKSTQVMMRIVGKIIKPGGTVLDTLAGTFETEKACLLLLKPSNSISGDSSITCVPVAAPYVVNTFALQLPNPKSDIEYEDKVRQDAKVFIVTMALLTPMRRRDVWEVPAGLHPRQCFQRNIAKCFQLKLLFLKCMFYGTSDKWRIHSVQHLCDDMNIMSCKELRL